MPCGELERGGLHHQCTDVDGTDCERAWIGLGRKLAHRVGQQHMCGRDECGLRRVDIRQRRPLEFWKFHRLLAEHRVPTYCGQIRCSAPNASSARSGVGQDSISIVARPVPKPGTASSTVIVYGVSGCP